MKEETNPFEAYRDSFITHTFRDTADRDYISARILCRHRLTEQFLWMALQSMEKYLKAILLFSDIDTRDVGHNIAKALNKARTIKPLGFAITEQAEAFIRIVGDYGPDRYFELPRTAKGDELYRLDRAVWEVRRFCANYFYPHDNPLTRKIEQAKLQYVQSEKIHLNRSSFKLDSGGFIEKVLYSKKHPELRKALIWNNLFFGSRNRKRILYKRIESWEQSAPYLYPEVYEWAKERVKLSPAIMETMRRLNKDEP
jgi:HEPN domain-containing protein